MSAPARWWRMDGDRILCELCPRACRLKPGQRAFCFVRKATESGMELTTYGRSSGFCIDPIEKKPLKHFLPGTSVLSFGTAGCNLGCRFCQNWSISKARQMDSLMESAGPADLAAAAKRTGCRSMAYTYNDPVIFAEYAIDVAEECHALGIKNVVVTAGYITEKARAEFFAPMDAASVDLKAFTERFYHKLTASKLGPVKDTLKYLVNETSVWVEITTLLIPEENDSDAELHEMCAWIREELDPDVPLHFTAYHPDFRMKRPRTPRQTLTRARNIALSEGLRYVYTGNVHDPIGNSTWCPNCNSLLIERDWHRLGYWGLDSDGSCANCGHKIPGLFEKKPGEWGAKRMRVRV